MKDWNYYTADDIHRPSKKDFTVVFVYNMGKVVHPNKENTGKLSSESIANFKKMGCIVEQVVDEAAYKEAIREYRKVTMQRNNEFNADALEDTGLKQSAKTSIAMQIAEDERDGYEEVFMLFERLAELIKD